MYYSFGDFKSSFNISFCKKISFCIPCVENFSVHLQNKKYYTGCLKKTLWTFNRLSCIINVAKQFNFYIERNNSYLISFSMILFLNHNDEKWPHTRQIKIAGRKITFFHFFHEITFFLGNCMENET